ncbi:filamin-binding LIM protein 1 [Corythoichthys intestinalis]|uniref:filamin-binding LIM protein 1 n=1 Tax=Corythoichthys intestinalis TaxID=161448 RepID=UPI0025A53F62|nr:filamin-binding LIM protein 1 [Corythoichthys intestinalis]
MASGDSNRKVSSVFITLAKPNQTKVEQRSGRQKGWVHAGPSQRTSASRSSAPEEPSQKSSWSKNSIHSGNNMGVLWKNDTEEVSDVFSPPPDSEMHSYPPDPLPTQSLLGQNLDPRPLTSPQPPPPNKEVVKRAPSSGMKINEQPNGTKENNPGESRGLCGFCQRPIPFTEAALTAMEKIYHKGCFRCTACNSPLAGQMFYQKAEVPECEACYENGLERCWSCGQKIKEKLLRALQRAYHPTCFSCVTCKQPLQNFIQTETGELYCPLDYGRKFAKTCSACHKIIMASDGSIPGHIESDGRIFHQECYRCEVCHVKFSMEKKEPDCYSLHGKRLCLSCIKKHQATTR